MKRCSDIMTREVTFCLPHDSTAEAARRMKAENVGPIPVVDDAQSRRLVGIITDRDITVKVIAEGREAKTTRVSEIMTANPVACQADDSIENAESAMCEHQVRRIPIVDANHRLLGIIAQADIATRVRDTAKTGDVVASISR